MAEEWCAVKNVFASPASMCDALVCFPNETSIGYNESSPGARATSSCHDGIDCADYKVEWIDEFVF